MSEEPRVTTPRRARLRPPRLAADVIARPRLVAQLDHLATLALVIAPAGYGKTTLVSLWLAERRLPYAWVSLEEKDNDPAQFLLAVVTALHAIDDELGLSLLRLLNAPTEPPFERLARLLIDELDARQEEFVLVLDDYHVLEEQRIHDLIVELVTYPPRAMTLIITSRHDPPIPQSLRVRSGACEIRTHELSFTAAETAAFMARVLGHPVDAQMAASVTAQSEGWVASVRLMALYARNQAPAMAAAALPHRSSRQVLDYLSTAVLDQLDGSVRDFLMNTSILERLNGALCDHLCGWEAGAGRGAALLRQLLNEGLFTVALDEDGHWYRYHALFRQVLQRTLHSRRTADEVTQLHRLAGDWFEQHGLLEDALHHALAGGERAGAVALVGRHRDRLLDNFELRRLDRWLALFPLDVIAGEVELLLTQVWVAGWRFNLPETDRAVQQLLGLLAGFPADTPQVVEWRGEIAGLQCQLILATGDAEGAIRAGEAAMAALPAARFYTRGYACLHLSVALQMAGRRHEASVLLDEFIGAVNVPRDRALMLAHHFYQFQGLIAADLPMLQRRFPAQLEIATAYNTTTILTWAHYFGGCANYLQYNLAAAAAHFRAVLDLVYYAQAGSYTHGAVGLALVFEAQGEPAAAVAVVEAARAHLAETRNTTMLQMMDAFAAEQAARQGRIDDARRWLVGEGRTLEFSYLPLFYLPNLAAIRVLLACGAPADLAEARTRVARAVDRSRRLHNVHEEIQSLVLAAAIAEAVGDRPGAVASLRQALALAEPAAMVAVFAEQAGWLLPVLAEITAVGGEAGFAHQVWSALERVSVAHETGPMPLHAVLAVTSRPVNEAPRASAPEVEHRLTFREVDVLRLLDQRLTNKEIGQRLGITTDTVKQHTVNLFRKLQVVNRRQAIVAGRARGYLSAGN